MSWGKAWRQKAGSRKDLGVPVNPWSWELVTETDGDVTVVGRLSSEDWPQALAVCGADGHLRHWNQALMGLLGPIDEEEPGLLITLLAAAGVDRAAEVLDLARLDVVQVHLRRADRLQRCWLRGMPLVGAGMVFTFLPAIAEAGHAERLRRQLSQLAHDTRSPLAVIQGYAGLLAAGVPGPVNTQQLGFLASIDLQVAELNRRLSMLVALAQQECGMLPFAAASCELLACLDQVLAAQVHLAAARRIDLSLSPAATSPVLETIPELLEQLLAHLVGLAVAACPDGGQVRLRVTASTTRATVALQGDGAPAAGRVDLEVLLSLASHLGAAIDQHSDADGRLALELHLPLVASGSMDTPAAVGGRTLGNVPQGVR
jgi:signal transduction histidine kinase